MSSTYTGHHAQHRGLQGHSVGGMYPYTIMGMEHQGKTVYAWYNCCTGAQGEAMPTYDEAYRDWETTVVPLGELLGSETPGFWIERVIGGWRAVDTTRPSRTCPVRVERSRAEADAVRMHSVDQFPKMPEGHTPSGSSETGIDWINFLGDVPQ